MADARTSSHRTRGRSAHLVPAGAAAVALGFAVQVVGALLHTDVWPTLGGGPTCACTAEEIAAARAETWLAVHVGRALVALGVLLAAAAALRSGRGRRRAAPPSPWHTVLACLGAFLACLTGTLLAVAALLGTPGPIGDVVALAGVLVLAWSITRIVWRAVPWRRAVLTGVAAVGVGPGCALLLHRLVDLQPWWPIGDVAGVVLAVLVGAVVVLLGSHPRAGDPVGDGA